MSSSVHLPSRGSLCVVAAHPDDAELAAFGTIARLSAQGSRCDVIVATSGERGVALSESAHIQAQERATVRRAECSAALASAGASVTFLRHDDGFVACNQSLISDIERTLRDLMPSTVVLHSADCRADHQDHSSVGRAALNAAARVRSVTSIWEMEPLCALKDPWKPNLFVDVTAEFERKMHALAEHRTQSGREYLSREWHEHRGRQNAVLAGMSLTDERIFEAFSVVRHSY